MIIFGGALEVPITSYLNLGGQGDRTSMITVSSNNAPNAGAVDKLVDGTHASLGIGNACRWSTGWPGLIITFTFVSLKYINEANIAIQTGAGGTWRWEVSKDASTNWIVASGDVPAGGDNLNPPAFAAGTIVPPDPAGYLGYRFNNYLGDASPTQNWASEFEFKIADGAT